MKKCTCNGHDSGPCLCQTEPFQADLPAHPKPGKKKKSAKIMNRKARSHDIEKPEDLSCKWCDTETGTECFRHAEDPDIKFLSGGGITGGKINDLHTVFGCSDCDTKMSNNKKKITYSEQDLQFMSVDELIEIVKYLEWKNKWKLGVLKTWP